LEDDEKCKVILRQADWNVQVRSLRYDRPEGGVAVP